MQERTILIANVITAIFLGEIIIYVLGFPVDSFGFWALYIQLEGCAIIIFHRLIMPLKSKKADSKAGQT